MPERTCWRKEILIGIHDISLHWDNLSFQRNTMSAYLNLCFFTPPGQITQKSQKKCLVVKFDKHFVPQTICSICFLSTLFLHRLAHFTPSATCEHQNIEYCMRAKFQFAWECLLLLTPMAYSMLITCLIHELAYLQKSKLKQSQSSKKFSWS